MALEKGEWASVDLGEKGTLVLTEEGWQGGDIAENLNRPDFFMRSNVGYHPNEYIAHAEYVAERFGGDVLEVREVDYPTEDEDGNPVIY